MVSQCAVMDSCNVMGGMQGPLHRGPLRTTRPHLMVDHDHICSVRVRAGGMVHTARSVSAQSEPPEMYAFFACG